MPMMEESKETVIYIVSQKNWTLFIARQHDYARY